MIKDKTKKIPSPPQLNQSAEKTMRILELLANSGHPMRLLDISTALELNPSTASRFLSTLNAMGYVEQEQEFSRYYLTYKLCRIANNIQNNLSLNTCASPYLHRLALDLGESVCLAIEESQQVVYIDVASGPDQIVKGMQRIGRIAPLHCTGIGKLLLLNYTYADLVNLHNQKDFTRFTANTITDIDSLFQCLETARRNGYALDDEECEIGARCVALPIYDYTNNIIAGFSVTGPASRITDAFIETHLPRLFKTSQDISHRLGYSYSSDF